MDKEKTRELMEKSLEFIKDTSIKFRKQAHRRWRISNLKLEVSSLKHQMGLVFKDMGRYIYEATKEDSLDNETYEGFFIKLGALEEKIQEKEELIQKIREEALKEESERLVVTGEDDEELSQYQESESISEPKPDSAPAGSTEELLEEDEEPEKKPKPKRKTGARKKTD